MKRPRIVSVSGPGSPFYGGGPSQRTVLEMRRALVYDSDCDAWAGIKIGKSYGMLFWLTVRALIPVRYDSRGPCGLLWECV